MVVVSVRLRLPITLLHASISTVAFVSGKIFRVAFRDELLIRLQHHFRVWGERLNKELSILFTVGGWNVASVGIESFACSEVFSRAFLL